MGIGENDLVGLISAKFEGHVRASDGRKMFKVTLMQGSLGRSGLFYTAKEASRWIDKWKKLGSLETIRAVDYTALIRESGRSVTIA